MSVTTKDSHLLVNEWFRTLMTVCNFLFYQLSVRHSFWISLQPLEVQLLSLGPHCTRNWHYDFVVLVLIYWRYRYIVYYLIHVNDRKFEEWFCGLAKQIPKTISYAMQNRRNNGMVVLYGWVYLQYWLFLLISSFSCTPALRHGPYPKLKTAQSFCS